MALAQVLKAECFGVGAAVVLGQDLAEVAGPVGDGTAADPAGETLPCATRTPCHEIRAVSGLHQGDFRL